MSDPINPAAPSRHVACYIVSGDNEGVSSDNGGEASIGQGSARQAGGWLHRVRLDAPCGVCTLPAVAALKDGSDSVCELEYCPLPPVCVADDEAQAADAAKARAVGRGETLDCPDTREMPPCPSEWDDSDRVGWIKYGGIPSVFHCGFRGMVADCNPDSDHLQQECFYDEAGQLVKGVKDSEYVHIDYRCAGTPNADDAMKHPIRHAFSKGGPLQSGWTAFWGTLLHADRQQHETENEADPVDNDGLQITR